MLLFFRQLCQYFFVQGRQCETLLGYQREKCDNFFWLLAPNTIFTTLNKYVRFGKCLSGLVQFLCFGSKQRQLVSRCHQLGRLLMKNSIRVQLRALKFGMWLFFKCCFRLPGVLASLLETTWHTTHSARSIPFFSAR